MSNGAEEIARLRRAFDEMPKVPGHGESAIIRHDNIRPEWVMQIIAGPHDRYEETSSRGERRTIIVGRVRESSQWIKLIFIGDPETGAFLTAYNDRRLERRYGGLPWEIQ